MKSRYDRKAASTRSASLERVLKKTEKIKQTVTSAAIDLTLVNQVLKQDVVPVETMKQALTQNEGVEQKVAKAADDLKLVNIKLTEEIAERGSEANCTSGRTHGSSQPCRL